MPYIACESRAKFQTPIKQIVDLFKEPNDTLYVKGEYFGYFLNRLVRKYLQDPGHTANSFNSAQFIDTKRKTLINGADSLCAAISSTDLLKSAGELNYAITSVLWGILGEADGLPEAGYGMRAYLRGMIDRINSTIETVNGGNQRDASLMFRRHLIIRGVLGDVISETYRRNTSEYEDKKMTENKDIWQDGKLVI